MSVTKTTAMGILLGMILCAGVVVAKALMDDTIRSEEDIEKYLGLSTLSVTRQKGLYKWNRKEEVKEVMHVNRQE